MIVLPDPMTATKISPLKDTLICASHTTYLVDIENPFMKPTPQFSSFTSQIHSLILSRKNTHLLAAAEGDRFINISDISLGKSIGSLVARGDVTHVDVDKQGLALAATMAEGIVEVFENPWSHESDATINGTDEEGSSRRKKPSTRTLIARIKVA